jgi:hypothetical protein
MITVKTMTEPSAPLPSLTQITAERERWWSRLRLEALGATPTDFAEFDVAQLTLLCLVASSPTPLRWIDMAIGCNRSVEWVRIILIHLCPH